MHILLTGATGFIGSALVPRLIAAGHTLTVYSRQYRANQTRLMYIDTIEKLDGIAPVDAVINLAGESLAAKRWTKAYKKRLLSSGIVLTDQLIETLASYGHTPAVFLSASAIGWYGNRDTIKLDEASSGGEGFAADLCEQWEASAQRAKDKLQSRVITLRLGVVLDRSGGAWPQLILPFKLGLQNWPGSGHQVLSWIHRQDAVAAIEFCLAGDLVGPVNVTAPLPVTYRELATAIASHKRLWLTAPIPAWAMRIMLGEMADELLLNGQYVVPNRLTHAGFEFEYADIETALSALLR